MKPCIFCQISQGQLAAEVVYQNPDVIAFLDHRPLFPGHVLVVPRSHRATLTDLLPHELAPLLEIVRLISLSMPRAMGCQGSFVANNNIVSQSVAHLHFHVVPRTKGDGLKGFFWPRQPYRSDEHFLEVGHQLRRVSAQEEILDFCPWNTGKRGRCRR